MPRDLPVSNGQLLVMFDRQYRIRDLYFPHVGKENHGTGHPFRFGVWVGGQFSWMGPEWITDMRYADSSMVTEVRARNPKLGVELICNDGVDFYENVLLRRVQIVNLADRPREIRCFFHHDFHIRGNEVGDTAFYSPETQALLHYKEDRYFLINCQVNGTVGVPHYACGNKEVTGQEGTWRDAEDGVLSCELLGAQTLEDLAPGLKLLEWAAERALPSGTMAEQLHPYTGEPLSVSPLTWSHAEYVRTVQEYIHRHSRANLCACCGQSIRPTERRAHQIVVSQP